MTRSTRRYENGLPVALALTLLASQLVGCTKPASSSPLVGRLAGTTRSVGTDPPQGWKEFESKNGRFSVHVPGEPIPESFSLENPGGEIVDGRMYHVSQIPRGILYFGYVDLGATNTDTPEQSLTSARDNFAKQRKGELVAEKRLAWNNYPGKEFEIALGTKGRLLVRAAVAKERMFVLGVAWIDERPEELIRTFFDSFRLSDEGTGAGWKADG